MKEKSKGLGDSIAKITHALGINRVADAVVKLAGMEGCGCDERKEYLNELFPYGKQRKFKVLKTFTFQEIEYEAGDIIKVEKNDAMFHYVIDYVKDEILEEI